MKTKRLLALLLAVAMMVVMLPTVAFAETLQVSFNGNGGTGTSFNRTTNSDGTITMPENNAFTHSGYEFVGWSTDPKATDIGVEHHRASVYMPGDSCTLTKRTVFYAVWAEQNVDATFYLRLDGRIPQEPAAAGEESNYNADSYTKGVTISRALKQGKFYANTTGVGDNLNSEPTNEQIVAMINDASSDLGFRVTVEEGNVVVTQITSSKVNAAKYNVKQGDILYVVWYVTKHALAGNVLAGNKETLWHVDGVLLTKAKVTLTYSSGNAPAGVVSSMPVGTQWTQGSRVIVGTNDTDNKTIMEPGRSDGYVFTGWEMYTKDDNGGYTVDKGQYNTGDIFVINEDTLLVAQWAKGSTTLKFQKVDQDGEPLEDVTFQISSEGKADIEFTTGATGAYTTAIENQTVYTVTETKAPTGYQKIQPFNFMVTTKDEVLGAYPVTKEEANGEWAIAANPDGVELSYDATSKTVSIRVTNIGYFYIWHSSTPRTEAEQIPMSATNADGTYDITKKVATGHIYGGYYKESGRTINDDDSITWTATDANNALDESRVYTESGLSMTPTVGTTYYLKEVPNTYLNPRIYYTYDTSDSTKAYPLTRIYPVTAVDDRNYAEVGFIINNGNPSHNGDTVYSTVKFETKQLKKDVGTYTISSTFSSDPALNTGYLYLDVTNPYYENKGTTNDDGVTTYSAPKWDPITIKPYFVTLDGVRVTGTRSRTYEPNSGVAPETTGLDEGVTVTNYLALGENISVLSTTTAVQTPAGTDATALLLVDLCELDWEMDESTTPVAPEAEEVTITTVVDGVKTSQTFESGTINIGYEEQDGKVFAGWFTEDGEAADLNDVQEDMTIYAKYIDAKSVRLNVTTSKGRGRNINVVASVNLPGIQVVEVGFLSDDGYNLSDYNKGSSYRATWTTTASGNSITVTPYWVTKDGTTVYGAPGTYRIRTSNSSLWGF